MNTIFNCDCLEGLKELEDNSIDLLVTDPPYGLSFMGKDWDKALPDINVFKECLRVLKPGSFAFVMTAPRSDLQARMSILLEDAGFNIGFTPIYWTFASGFPKAMNMSKAIDKRLGAEREIIGQRTKARSKGQKSPLPTLGSETEYITINDTKSATPLAQEFDGAFAGFQPKPAVEVVIVAMKPLSEKSYIDQVMSNGKGVTWLDDARIPFTTDPYKEGFRKNTPTQHQEDNFFKGKGKEGYKKVSSIPNSSGRFPGNLLCSDDSLNDGMERKSTKSSYNFDSSKNDNATRLTHNIKSGIRYGDSGSFSRYFDLDAWWEHKIKELPENIQRTYPFIIVPKASKSEKNKGLEVNNIDNSDKYGRKFPCSKADRFKNVHPTVKPLKLMSYLITLGSRPGDTILDPYAGSGTTLIAAKLLQRNYIGYEREPEYHNIATHRLKAHEPPKQKQLI